MIPPLSSWRESGAENVMLEKSFLVRLDASPHPELFLPWREWAAEVEHERKPGPGNREQVNPEQSGPRQNQQAPEHDEDDVCHMSCRHRPSESSPDHVVAVGSNVGFSMIPTMFPNGSFTEPTFIPSPTSCAFSAISAPIDFR